MAVILATLLLFVWAALAFTALPERPNFSKIPIWRPRHPTLVILALLLGIVGFYVRYHFPNPNEVDNWFWAFVIDLAPEMVGMAFTVVVIDELNQRRLEQQEKDRLFAQVKSPVRDMAVEALRLIRENNWLGEVLEKYNRNLHSFQWQGADLRGANLQAANLTNANLRGAVLSSAKLEGANLVLANLEGATMWFTNLEGAILWGTNLEGADLSRANLQGVKQLEAANLRDAKYSEETIWPEDFDHKNAGAIKISWDVYTQVGIFSISGGETFLEGVRNSRECLSIRDPFQEGRPCLTADY